ncbi:MAG: NAD/NADP octopine/nopaline dehydrogenase family protein [Elusimicrobiaceae bacterium]|nr:NAD/NADP octopine/nopaline dehydrogenase family protein [Elusimicrobiaceae bacterium]
MKHICICGGGHLGHVIGGFLAHRDYQVSLLTSSAEKWQKTLQIYTPGGAVLRGDLFHISQDPSIVKNADMLLLCLPGYCIADALRRIKPHLSKQTQVGCVVGSSGFFFLAHEILGDQNPLFAFQRVPFIARVKEYGRSACLLGYKKELAVATLHHAAGQALAETLEEMFATPVVLLPHFLQTCLTNSNPILHTSRLYSLFHRFSSQRPYEKEILFYEDWDLESSLLLVACDAEFQAVMRANPAKLSPVPPLLTYYESQDAAALTNKIRSIQAFQGIKAPMKKQGTDRFVPDFANRYFTEDFCFGLAMLHCIAEILQVPTPHLDMLWAWGGKVIENFDEKRLKISAETFLSLL